MALGRSLSRDFWLGNLDAVWERMDAPMRDALGDDPKRLAGAREQILGLAGGPGETLEERVAEVRGVPVYLRIFRGANGTGPLLEQWALPDGEAVAGFYVRPTDLQAKTPPRPNYTLAVFALTATALVMAGLNVWVGRRTKEA